MILVGTDAVPDPRQVLPRAWADPELRATSEAFPTRPEVKVPAPTSVYVGQGELAVVRPDHARYIGSSEATSCVIMCLWDPATRLCSVAHLDGSHTPGTVAALLEPHRRDGPILLHLVGAAAGVSEDKSPVPEVLLEIFRLLIAAPHRVRLITACVAAANTRNKGSLHYPLATSLVLHVHTGEVAPAEFLSHGPCPELRHSRFLGDCPDRRYPNVIDFATGDFVVAPFSYRGIPPPRLLAYMSLVDAELLASCSSTPHCEAPGFCDRLRATFRFLLDHPTFPSAGPLVFRRDAEGRWQPLPTRAPGRVPTAM